MGEPAPDLLARLERMEAQLAETRSQLDTAVAILRQLAGRRRVVTPPAPGEGTTDPEVRGRVVSAMAKRDARRER